MKLLLTILILLTIQACTKESINEPPSIFYKSAIEDMRRACKGKIGAQVGIDNQGREWVVGTCDEM